MSNTYTLVYRSICKNRAAADQAALMIANAPIDPFVAEWTVMGLTLGSDTPSTSGFQALRTVVLHDAADEGAIPPGAIMAQTLTNFMTGAISTGIVAPVTADAVSVT